MISESETNNRDAVAHAIEDVVGHAVPVGGHAVGAGDGADGGDVFVGAFVTHDADGFDGGEDDQGLPDFAGEAGAVHFFAHDEVGFLVDAHLLGGDVAEDTNCQAWAWEWLAPNDAIRQAEFSTDGTNFVFEEETEGLDEVEAEVLRQAPYVVVALNDGGWAAVDALAFDHVWVERALAEEFDFAAEFVFDAFGFFFEDGNEFCTDDFAFLFWIRNTGEQDLRKRSLAST